MVTTSTNQITEGTAVKVWLLSNNQENIAVSFIRNLDSPMAYWSEFLLATQRVTFRSGISVFPYSSFKFKQRNFPDFILTGNLRILMSSAITLETKLPGNTKVVDDVDYKSLTNDDWKKRLSPEQFAVCRLGGTELAHSGKYYYHNKPGIYICVCCKQPLFSSEHKFDCACGWPTYTKAISGSVTIKIDSSRKRKQRAVNCAKCDSHLGHLFAEGPPPVGNSFCVNSIALDFLPSTST